MKKVSFFTLLSFAISIFLVCTYCNKTNTEIENCKIEETHEIDEKEYEEKNIVSVSTIVALSNPIDEDKLLYQAASNAYEMKLNELEETDDKYAWYIEYKTIVEKYSDIIDPPENIYDYFSEDEVYLIQRMVETETYGAPFDAKVNVANVAFNRLYSGEYGDSIKEIITKPNQFAYHRKSISEDTIIAVEYAFELTDTTNGALSFHSNSKTNTFNRQKYIFTDVAGHHFYGKEGDINE